MNMREHAEAISSAIQAAHNAGFELDNGDGYPIREMDLNAIEDGKVGDYMSIELPVTTFDY
ncbi:hypothetical protein ACFTUC_17130 [Streptomyces sp. NPDC056944]|uniref:hypothetical protein n=1 Tax=Streptomyces sp. NPDC056944 TaxID=3345972 RepID=UPI00363CF1EE